MNAKHETEAAKSRTNRAAHAASGRMNVFFFLFVDVHEVLEQRSGVLPTLISGSNAAKKYVS